MRLLAPTPKSGPAATMPHSNNEDLFIMYAIVNPVGKSRYGPHAYLTTLDSRGQWQLNNSLLSPTYLGDKREA